MTILALLENDGLTPTRKGPSEYSSPCPACGGRDRFVIFTDKGRYWCRQCGAKGDSIQYLRSFHGLSFRDAAGRVGKDSIRSNGPNTEPPRRIPAEPRQEQPANWSTEAEKLIAYAHRALMQNPKVLSWLLTERGIRRETAERFRLGWIERNLFVEKERCGLSGGGKKLFIPSGLLIPWQSRRIRIRRDNPDRYGRYYVLPGSDIDPMTVGHPEQTTGVIVESELDAILLVQESDRELFIVALGSAQVKPEEKLQYALNLCPVLLVALDTDLAGARAAQWWTRHFDNAFRTMTPKRFGKDISEAFSAGMDLNQWLSASMALYCDSLLDQNGVSASSYTQAHKEI